MPIVVNGFYQHLRTNDIVRVVTVGISFLKFEHIVTGEKGTMSINSFENQYRYDG